MPSNALRGWSTSRSVALDEMARAHAAVGGSLRGRRRATQQINRSYAVLLASQFQGFCRDLHTECVGHLVNALSPESMRLIVWQEFTSNRQLDRGNAQSGSLGSDFGRLGIEFWSQVKALQVANLSRKRALDVLNEWRNAIVHQSLDPGKLGGTTILRLSRVRSWRSTCGHLARSFDEVMRLHIQTQIGESPWRPST